MDERVKGQSKRLCTLLFFCLFSISGVVLFPLPQSATLTKAMQIAGVQSLDLKMADSFLCCTIFSSIEVFSAVGVFSPEEGVGPPPLNHTHLAPATDLHMHMPQL